MKDGERKTKLVLSNDAFAHASMQERKRDGKTVVVSDQSVQISLLLLRPDQSFYRHTHRPESSRVIVRENIH